MSSIHELPKWEAGIALGDDSVLIILENDRMVTECEPSDADRIAKGMNTLKDIVEFIDFLYACGPLPFSDDNDKEWKTHRANAIKALTPHLGS